MTNLPAAAINLLNQLLEYDKKLILAYYRLGKLYYKTEDKIKAKIMFEKFISENSENDEYMSDAKNTLKKINFILR